VDSADDTFGSGALVFVCEIMPVASTIRLKTRELSWGEQSMIVSISTGFVATGCYHRVAYDNVVIRTTLLHLLG